MGDAAAEAMRTHSWDSVADRDDGALRADRLETPGRLSVAFVVNGGESSAMGDRASAFAVAPERPVARDDGLSPQPGRRRVSSFARWLRADGTRRIVYVLDMALAGVLAGAWRTLGRSTPLVIDTGDAIAALARSSGMRGPLGLLATAALERYSLRAADHIVVRGTFHRELLAEQGIDATVIPDGVDLRASSRRSTARPCGARSASATASSSAWSARPSGARRSASPTAGTWSRCWRWCSDLPVRGLLVGDGSGIEHLRERARVLGVEDRIVFAGRRPLAELPALLSACDVCLSTQTNDIPGNVRTTGKLPLYLACGRYVLASRVGEAARVLPDGDAACRTRARWINGYPIAPCRARAGAGGERRRACRSAPAASRLRDSTSTTTCSRDGSRRCSPRSRDDRLAAVSGSVTT